MKSSSADKLKYRSHGVVHPAVRLNKTSVLLLILLAAATPYVRFLPAYAILTQPSTVCVTRTSSTSCPSSPIMVTGLLGEELKIAVNIDGPNRFNAFDIRVATDTQSVNATSVDFTGSLLPVNSTTLVAMCINGAGSGCDAALDGPGVVRVAVNATGYVNAVSTGRLFAVTYKVVGLSTDTYIWFKTLKVTQTPRPCFEGSCNSKLSIWPMQAVFSNFSSVVPGFTVTIVPSLTFNSTARTLTGTFQVTVANDTDGTVLFSKTITIFVRVGMDDNARLILEAPVSPAALGVSCSVNAVTGSIVAFVLGSPDTNQDGIVNIVDLVTLALAFGSTDGSSRYNLSVDLNRDGLVNIVDLTLVATNFAVPVFR